MTAAISQPERLGVEDPTQEVKARRLCACVCGCTAGVAAAAVCRGGGEGREVTGPLSLALLLGWTVQQCSSGGIIRGSLGCFGGVFFWGGVPLILTPIIIRAPQKTNE